MKKKHAYARKPSLILTLFITAALIMSLNLVFAEDAVSSASIRTDKADYSPEETVTIFGSGFSGSAEVTVTVTRPDGSVDPPAWIVNSDESGNFETAYLLDGILGTYTVVATDGTNTATTTFTDGRAVKFNETGLPIGTTWSVTLDGVTLSSTTTKVTDTIQFNDKDPGTYSFNIPPVSIGPGAQLAASPSSGTVEVPSSGSGAVNVGVTFSTQYYLTMSTNFGTVSPVSGWYTAGVTVAIEAYAPSVVTGERYVWNGWTGVGTGSYTGVHNPTTGSDVTMNGPITETASWTHEYELTMAANFGTTSPAIGGGHWYTAGVTVAIEAYAPSVVTGERYVWNGWTGVGTGSYTGVHNPTTGSDVTMNGPITETASWIHQYKLTVNVNPNTIDISNVNINPTGEDIAHNGYWISYWYDSGDSVVLTATKFVSASGVQYIFDHWSGSATGTTNPVTVTMNAPKTVTANYGILPFSAVTSSSLCPLTDNKFKLLFIQDMQNPNTYRLTASNPGQFYYNVFYLGTPEASYSFDITIPAPFVTQGAMPVHIYSDVSFIGGCYVPANEIGVLGTQITGTSGGTIHVEGEVPSTGLVYVAIHLDYGLKGIPPNYKPDASYNAYDTTLVSKLIPNGESYKFSYSGHETSVSNVNDFKKIPGFGGLIQSGGSPVVGVTVTVTIGSTSYSAKTNSDGFYLINYKTGKAQSYTLSAGSYGSASGTIKANGFIVNNFIS